MRFTNLRKGIKGQKGKKSELGKITKELSNVRNNYATWTRRQQRHSEKKTTRKKDDFKEKSKTRWDRYTKVFEKEEKNPPI